MRTRTSLAALVFVALTACACAEAPAAPTRPTPRTHTVRIEGMSFRPVSLTVAAGDTVVWVNKDLVPHAAATSGEGFDSKALDFNKSYQQTFATPGQFEYVCPFHPTMKATLRVQ